MYTCIQQLASFIPPLFASAARQFFAGLSGIAAIEKATADLKAWVPQGKALSLLVPELKMS